MRTSIFILLLLILCVNSFAQDSIRFYFNNARAAYAGGDTVQYYELMKKTRKLHPYHREVLYHSSIAAAMMKENKEALFFLEKAANINSNYNTNIPEFEPLKKDPVFSAIIKSKEALQKKIITSDTAFTLTDRQLHLECVAEGEKRGTFYVGSVYKRKIVKVVNGKVEDFTSDMENWMGAVLAIKVDKKSSRLWATSSVLPEMQKADVHKGSYVAMYDVNTRHLLQTFYPSDTLKDHVLGDLIHDRAGNVFASDSRNNVIYRVNVQTKKLDAFFTSKQFWNIQGIAFSPDEKYLFVADYIKGIFRLDLKTQELLLIPQDFAISLQSTDGLLCEGNSLIVIQNGVTPMRVGKVTMNKDRSRFTRYDFIDNNHPAFNEPTNGCIIGGTLYYVANSQWSGYSEGRIKPENELQDIVVLKAKLK